MASALTTMGNQAVLRADLCVFCRPATARSRSFVATKRGTGASASSSMPHHSASTVTWRWRAAPTPPRAPNAGMCSCTSPWWGPRRSGGNEPPISAGSWSRLRGAPLACMVLRRTPRSHGVRGPTGRNAEVKNSIGMPSLPQYSWCVSFDRLAALCSRRTVASASQTTNLCRSPSRYTGSEARSQQRL